MNPVDLIGERFSSSRGHILIFLQSSGFVSRTKSFLPPSLDRPTPEHLDRLLQPLAVSSEDS